MVLIFFRLVVQSLALPFCLSMSSIHFPPSSSSSGLATSQSCPLPCFSRFLYALCLCPNLHPPSLPLAIFLHLELSLFCLFSLPRPSVNLVKTPSLSYLSFPSGLSISPGRAPPVFISILLRFPHPVRILFRPLNPAPPSPSPSPSPSLWAILLCSRCSARRKYSLFAPLDMAKEAICALLAILEHFFEAFSPLDLFFALAPFRPASSAFPCFPPSRLSSLSASAHPVSSSIPTYSISRPSAQVNIIPAWFPSLSETSARAVFIFRASVA